MIDTTQIITEFVGKNWLALGGILGLLKILAKESSNNVDDKIVSFLSGWISGTKQQKPPSGKPIPPSPRPKP